MMSPLLGRYGLIEVLLHENANIKGDDPIFKEMAKHKKHYKKILCEYVRKESSILLQMVSLNMFPAILKLLEMDLVDFSKKDKNNNSLLYLVASYGKGHILKAMLSYISDKELPYFEWCGSVMETHKYNVDMYARMDESVYKIANEFPELLGGLLIMTPEVVNEDMRCTYLREILVLLLDDCKKKKDLLPKIVEFLHSFTDNVERINHPVGKLLFMMDEVMIKQIDLGGLNTSANKKFKAVYTKLATRLESQELRGLVNVSATKNKENKI